MFWEVLMQLYRFVGSLTCHQIPSRSLEAGGAYIHVCARDTGIYLGALVSILFIHFSKRTGADRPPALKYGIAFCIMFLPMVIDGITSYLGFRATYNEIRLFTGLLFGIPIPFLLLPLMNFKVEGNNTVEIIKGWNELGIIIAAATGLGISALNIEELFGSGAAKMVILVISSLIVFSQIYVFFKLSQVIVYLFWKGSRAGGNAMSIIVMASCLSVLYVISHYLLQPLRIIYGI